MDRSGNFVTPTAVWTDVPIACLSEFQTLEQVLDERLVLFTQSPMKATPEPPSWASTASS
ncbi:hypothetical protein H257_16676 [Aphanomyces astaci]|uniref:Uncharacterized protein n=1 Tax=Aphanomyces astaci TaxID=112090 RepID=W4FJG8_APHAT|nr:hypothetical protein H257_16676 [Aphanomyces astaci]ETV66986.1 hypothetical protein H257_16676 [Aphanomyces astaci]|eukprot:XP_009843503.1 hypothetical protein H257_16676 [Aphanomyces astaci]